MNIVYNAIKTPDGTILESTHRHDYRTYLDKNGYTYMVDGGVAYLRRNIVKEAPATDLSVYLEDGHEKVREFAKWGTYGKTGNEPFRRVALKDMESDHIRAVLKVAQSMASQFRTAFENELKFRGEMVEQSK